MADAAITFLLENLQKLIVDHVNLISGAKDELKQLQNVLELLKSILEDSVSCKKRVKGKVFKTMEKQIREFVNEAQDTIDSCTSEAAQNSSRWLKWPQKRGRLAEDVKLLREKAKEVLDNATKVFAKPSISDEVVDKHAEYTIDRIRKIEPVGEKKIVGFQEDADALIKYLKEESEELEVIAVTGMPGLGKTTLAWKIYGDSKIRFHFPTVIWVYVSQEYSRKDIYLTILKTFTKQDISRRTDEDLAQKVHHYLEKTKFLLIMDDVWTPEAWKDIQVALPKENGLGKVLITSRDKTVACHANCKREPHQLRFLTEEESWELLQLEVFGKVGECPSELKEVGEIIAKQCDGLPLALVVIGGILVDKFSTAGDRKNEWKRVSDSVSTYIKDDRTKRMKNIISLSYNNLPYDLRDCFLYLGMFPEDFEIPSWNLVRLWIAEGFIKQKPGKRLEETAEENLKQLINWNLVMVDKMNSQGTEVKTCHIHDMIREFCRSEAAYEEQNLFQEMRKFRGGVFEPEFSELPNFRRLCIHSGTVLLDFFGRKPKPEVPHVRSFWCFSKETIRLPLDYIHPLTDAFNLLRVFDVNSLIFTRFPQNVARLVHLRYMALSGEGFDVLPEAISKLWNLETVIIHTSSRILKIRADISKMKQLRHLKTKAAIILTKEGKGTEAAEKLRTLSRLSPQSCKKQVFDGAPNIQTLGVRGKLSPLILNNTCFKELGYLEELKLVNDVFPESESSNPLLGLPGWDSFPPNLRILSLSATHLHWNHMATLGMLGKLEVLKLRENAFVGERWDVIDGGFCSLEFLQISRTNLQYWTVSGTDSFPKLRGLVLRNCEKLEAVPFSLGETLQKLCMERVTQAAVQSAKEIERAKQQMEGQHTAKRSVFKLEIAPGDEQSD